MSNEQRKADYLAGFMDSGQGWNGEVIGSPELREEWLANRDKTLFEIGLTGEQLRKKYDIAHPQFTREEWREEVFSDLTIRGYWDWVAAKLEEQEKP